MTAEEKMTLPELPPRISEAITTLVEEATFFGDVPATRAAREALETLLREWAAQQEKTVTPEGLEEVEQYLRRNYPGGVSWTNAEWHITRIMRCVRGALSASPAPKDEPNA